MTRYGRRAVNREWVLLSMARFLVLIMNGATNVLSADLTIGRPAPVRKRNSMARNPKYVAVLKSC